MDNGTNHTAEIRRRSAAAPGLALAAALLTGCGSRTAYEFDALDLTPAQDELTEFLLGKFTVPIPVAQSFNRSAPAMRNRLEFSFELHALVAREDQARLDDLWAQHEGKVRDRILRVCRSASIEDLQEPEMATLKSQLTDAVLAQLGPRSIRRLLMTEVVLREL